MTVYPPHGGCGKNIALKPQLGVGTVHAGERFRYTHEIEK
jgi:hypothetical protein